LPLNPFSKTIPRTRLVRIRPGDTLQRIAARELGDATLWPDLVYLNGLVWPFIVASQAQAAANVLVEGDSLQVPETGALLPGEQGLSDLMLVQGQLVVASGDLALVTGNAAAMQSITVRLAAETGDLIFHLGFGSSFRRIIGQGGGPETIQIAEAFVRKALLGDPRVVDVPSSVVTISGDSLRVEATARLRDGAVVPVSGVF